MSYDGTQGERIVRESERCLLADSCLLYQYAKRLVHFPGTTFYCSAASELFHEALAPYPDDIELLDYVLSRMVPLAYCYRLDDHGEWIDG